VVWVEIPSLAISRVTQRYERLTEDRCRFTARDFSALLTTDHDGLVCDYEGLFRRISRR
jgi:hypothetical protein